MIKVLIVDDQKILLDGIAELFHGSDLVTVVGSITLPDLVEIYCSRKAPDLVLMDICMESKTTGFFVTKRLKKKFPNIKVVLMTGFPEWNFIQKAREAGADSFIYKDGSADDFISCIRRTMEGEHVYPLPDGKESFGFGFYDARLTRREMEILSLLCRNMSRKEVAQALGIAGSTVNFHINNMLTKTGHKNIVGLAVEAANRGYIDPEVGE